MAGGRNARECRREPDRFGSTGQDESGKPFLCREGGSPFNVAIAMTRLGAIVGILCPTTDALGVQLRARLAEAGVANFMVRPPGCSTALVVVSTDATGHPSYAFRQQGTADRTLNRFGFCEALPESLEALHFGSVGHRPK